jgi:hypothetical protein
MSTPDLDDPKTLVGAWICFERCFGTLEQLKYCQEQCQSVLLDYEWTQQKLLFKTKNTVQQEDGLNHFAGRKKRQETSGT